MLISVSCLKNSRNHKDDRDYRPREEVLSGPDLTKSEVIYAILDFARRVMLCGKKYWY